MNLFIAGGKIMTKEIKMTNSSKKINKGVNILLYNFIKRVFDIVASLIFLLVLLPVVLIISILIKISDGGPIFFIQKRIGKNGDIFNMYKFRSMVMNADSVLEEMLKDEEVFKDYHKNKKLKNDPRVTKIGIIIRKLSLDELPQLLNVLKGNMSLIGNRPYLPREMKDMGEYYNDIIKTKPGITGYWQVSGRSNISFKKRLELEKFYSNNANLALDVKIFFLTIYVVLSGHGAE